MKKIIIIICTFFLIVIIAMAGIYIFKDNYISCEEAKKIAMDYVSNKNNEYTFNSIEFTENNNTYVYTLTFTDNINFYTYKINAKNKSIISSKKESLTNNKSYMNEEDILNIVFEYAKLNKNHCNLISNIVILEDGIPFYNTVFFYNNIRYEYKINAFTGSIISVIKLNENATE